MDLNQKLSPHFTLRELTNSQTATRHGIDNTPDEAALSNLKLICTNVLEPIRAHFGKPFTPSSGFRCLELNRKIGSKDTSQHTLGQAVDIEVPGVSNFILAKWIEANLEYDQLILEHYKKGDPSSGWVHVSYKTNGRKFQTLTFNGKNYARGLIG